MVKIIKRRRGDKQRAERQLNSSMPENKDNHLPLSGSELEAYNKQMLMITGGHILPPINYKGRFIPKRIFTDFSYLTSTPKII